MAPPDDDDVPLAVPPPRNFKGSWKTYIALGLGLLQVALDICALVITLHTYELGSHMSRYFSDKHVVVTIEICAKLSHLFTTLLAGWAASQLYDRRL